MEKKNTFAPGVLITFSEPQPTTVVGGGTGQSTTNPFPCNFSTWQTLFSDDFTFDHEENFDDYMQWWYNNKFSMEAWDEYNPGVEFKPPIVP